jgi:hypothetical protein
MQQHTFTILDATLRADSTVTSAQRSKFLKLARGEDAQSATAQNGNGQPRIYSRVETAKLLGDKTPRFVDLLCRRGLLKKFTPKGNQRSIGITAESFNRFLEGAP